MSRETRVLSPEMEKEFTNDGTLNPMGILNPLLKVVQRDRDLILEFLDPCAAVSEQVGPRFELTRPVSPQRRSVFLSKEGTLWLFLL